MYKVTVPNTCDCFNNSEFKAFIEFDTNEKALDYAIDLKDKMNKDFCSKHKFEVLKIFNDYVISTVNIKEKSLKCCGSGCCF